MNGNCCREGAPSFSRRSARRFIEAAGFVTPGVAMALLPKCPACLAAWLALAMGVGLSAPAAGILRAALLVLSLAPAIFLAARARRRAWRFLRGRFEMRTIGAEHRADA